MQTFTDAQFSTFVVNLVNTTVKATLIELGHDKPEISQNKAFKIYGRAKVESWMVSGKVKPNRNKETGRWTFSKTELEIAKSTEELKQKAPVRAGANY